MSENENMEEENPDRGKTVIRKGGKVYLKFRGNLYQAIEEERPIPKGRYIVYPYGAQSWSEIKETVDLLREEGDNPPIVKYNGLWNVEAGVKVNE